LVNAIAIVVIALIWLYGWHVGRMWTRSCGVRERGSLWALACVFPTAGLAMAVQLAAIAETVTGRVLIGPAQVAVAFLLLCRVGKGVVEGQQHQSVRTLRPRVASPPGISLKWLWAPVLVVGLAYAVFLADAITGPVTGARPQPASPPQVAWWTGDAAAEVVPDPPRASVPESGEVATFLLASAGLERCGPVTRLLDAVLLAAVIHALARSLGAGTRAAAVAVCITLSVPVVLVQSFAPGADLYAAAAWLSSLLAMVWAMRVEHDRQRRNLLVLAGLAAGAGVGSGWGRLAAAALLVLIVLAEGWLRPQEFRTAAPRPLRNMVLFCVVGLLCSGCWLADGLARTGGRRLRPESVVAAAPSSFAEPSPDAGVTLSILRRRIASWWDYPWREPRGIENGSTAATGAAYATFVPIGLAAAVFSFAGRRFGNPTERWKLVYVTIACGGLLLALVLPRVAVRDTLAQVLLLVPVAAVLIDRLMVRFPRSVLLTLTAALVMTVTITAREPARAVAERVRDAGWHSSPVAVTRR